ncbi:MAG: hypothetical protein HY701_01135 [Gemmatimonadetes bacterium]|nr:hypothetical protein [Gemmatimonadota bacterium]
MRLVKAGAGEQARALDELRAFETEIAELDAALGEGEVPDLIRMCDRPDDRTSMHRGKERVSL